MNRPLAIVILLIITTALLLLLNLFCGSVSIPAREVLSLLVGGGTSRSSWTYILTESRLPQALTAMVCGASLSTAGLLLQTAFRNPLAGPSILGITNGAGLGVGIVMLVTGGVVSIGGSTMAGFVAVVAGAFMGAMTVIALLLFMAGIVRSGLRLLIIGIMLSYLASSMVMMLNFFATADSLQNYVMWGMGSFSDVTREQLPWMLALSCPALISALLLIKPLNALLLGNDYAANLGVNLRLTRWLLLAITGMLTATATAFCGPVAFIGLAVPHMARLATRTADHSTLLPATMVCGAAVALACNVICTLPQNSIIPLNAVTPVFGAPVILYILLRRR